MKKHGMLLSGIVLTISILILSGCEKIDCTNCETDNKTGKPLYSIDVRATVKDSLTQNVLMNAVVWVKNTYSNDIALHTITNDLGNFQFHLNFSDNDFLKYYTIYISKGKYELKKINLELDTVDISLNITLLPDAHDTIKPFCLAYEMSNNALTGNTEVIFYFSEEVEFDSNHIKELAQIIFRRDYDLCSPSSGTYLFEHQSDMCAIKPASIKFVHRRSDSGTCYFSDPNTKFSYSFTQTSYWTLYSVQMLSYLCHDMSGNYLKEYSWIGK
jgi:hypothetical protein